MQTNQQNLSKQRTFSVELNSKANLKNVSITSNQAETVLIEGCIGELKEASFDDDVILQVVGSKGTLRLDLAPKEITKPQSQPETNLE